MKIRRIAAASWLGSGKDGKGTVSTGGQLLENAPYSFSSRFEEGKGTNPEELIGAAHAGCYTMALSFLLAADGIKSEKIDTQATVTIEAVSGSIEITAVHLKVTARVPDISASLFQEYAQKAKTGCAVSKLLKVALSMEAALLEV